MQLAMASVPVLYRNTHSGGKVAGTAYAKEIYPARQPAQKGLDMKTNFKPIILLGAMGIAFAIAQPCVAATPRPMAPPPVTAPAPPPGSYVWDGHEFVGTSQGLYYYLGHDNVWHLMDPTRFHRFEVWQNHHPDWRAHATRNLRYHDMSNENHPAPMRESTGPENPNQIPSPDVNPGQFGPH